MIKRLVPALIVIGYLIMAPGIAQQVEAQSPPYQTTCQNFEGHFQDEAQRYFRENAKEFYYQQKLVDGDHNRIVCETLACPCDTVPLPVIDFENRLNARQIGLWIAIFAGTLAFILWRRSIAKNREREAEQRYYQR